MPPNVRKTSGPGTIIQWLGETFSLIFYLFLIAIVVIPTDVLPVSQRGIFLLFTAGFGVLTLLPPTTKLLSDVSDWLGFLAAFLGEFPFHHWTLYYHPLLDRVVRKHWPDGLYYATVAFHDDGVTREHLILDDLVEPMNISGLVLHFLPTAIHTEDAEYRRELLQYLGDFLRFKINHYQRTGRYSISNRILKRLSFPTANIHLKPDLDLAAENLEGIRIYHVHWPDSLDSLDLRAIDWSEPHDDYVELVASYCFTDDWDLRETCFDP